MLYIRPRMMIAEADGSPGEVQMYYGRTKDGGANFPFNFLFTRIDETFDGYKIRDAIEEWMKFKPEDAPANWVVGIHRSYWPIKLQSSC